MDCTKCSATTLPFAPGATHAEVDWLTDKRRFHGLGGVEVGGIHLFARVNQTCVTPGDTLAEVANLRKGVVPQLQGRSPLNAHRNADAGTLKPWNLETPVCRFAATVPAGTMLA